MVRWRKGEGLQPHETRRVHVRIDLMAYVNGATSLRRQTLSSFILPPSSLLNDASLGGLYKLDEFCYFLAIGNQFPDLLKGLGGV